MPADNSTPPRGGSYLRKSSKSQEGSIEQQRAEIRRLAAREGIEITREYADEGISSGESDIPHVVTR